MIDYCLDRGQPEQVMYAWARNDKEDELFSEYDSDLSTYIDQTRAQFCTGILDPSSDTDWNNYVKELKSLHYYDAWIEVAQAIWDREYKN